MNHELARMQAQLDRLSNELCTAQQNIRRLETKATWRPNAMALTCLALVVALGIVSFGAKASSGNDPKTPPTLSSTVPNKVTAPFEVVDDQGRTIFRVQDRDASPSEGSLGRGAYIFDPSNKAVVNLTSTTTGGGVVRVNSISGDQNYVTMAAVADTTAMEVRIGDKESVLIGQLHGKDPVVQLDNASGKPAATLGVNGNDGLLSVFGSGDKPVATLQSDAGDGKLWISDKSGNAVAGVFANDNGGVVKVMKNGDPTTYASMSAINAGMGLAVRVAGVRKSYVGTNSEGYGAVYVYGHGDNQAAVLTTIKGGKGLIAVFNDQAAIAMLSESDKHPGGGEVSVTDPDGNGVFAAGYAGEGGEACVNQKNGLKCLGIGLPLQINE